MDKNQNFLKFYIKNLNLKFFSLNSDFSNNYLNKHVFFFFQIIGFLNYFFFSLIWFFLKFLVGAIFYIIISLPFFFGKMIYLGLQFFFFIFFKFVINLCLRFWKLIFFLFFFFYFRIFEIYPNNQKLGWGTYYWYNKCPRSFSPSEDYLRYLRSVSKFMHTKSFKFKHVLLEDKNIEKKFYEFNVDAVFKHPTYLYEPKGGFDTSYGFDNDFKNVKIATGLKQKLNYLYYSDDNFLDFVELNTHNAKLDYFNFDLVSNKDPIENSNILDSDDINFNDSYSFTLIDNFFEAIISDTFYFYSDDDLGDDEDFSVDEGLESTLELEKFMDFFRISDLSNIFSSSKIMSLKDFEKILLELDLNSLIYFNESNYSFYDFFKYIIKRFENKDTYTEYIDDPALLSDYYFNENYSFELISEDELFEHFDEFVDEFIVETSGHEFIDDESGELIDFSVQPGSDEYFLYQAQEEYNYFGLTINDFKLLDSFLISKKSKIKMLDNMNFESGFFDQRAFDELLRVLPLGRESSIHFNRQEQFFKNDFNFSLWKFVFGKFNNELIWKHTTFSPTPHNPVFNRFTAGDYWVFKRGYKMGLLTTFDVYKYLETSIFLKFLKKLEQSLIYFIFNILPADVLLVEFKYFILKYFLTSIFLENFLQHFSNWVFIDCLDLKWFVIRLFLILSDCWLWFSFAFLKILFTVLINMIFDDLCGTYMFYLKVFDIYQIDAFIPLKRTLRKWPDNYYRNFNFHDLRIFTRFFREGPSKYFNNNNPYTYLRQLDGRWHKSDESALINSALNKIVVLEADREDIDYEILYKKFDFLKFFDDFNLVSFYFIDDYNFISKYYQLNDSFALNYSELDIAEPWVYGTTSINLDVNKMFNNWVNETKISSYFNSLLEDDNIINEKKFNEDKDFGRVLTSKNLRFLKYVYKAPVLFENKKELFISNKWLKNYIFIRPRSFLFQIGTHVSIKKVLNYPYIHNTNYRNSHNFIKSYHLKRLPLRGSVSFKLQGISYYLGMKPYFYKPTRSSLFILENKLNFSLINDDINLNSSLGTFYQNKMNDSLRPINFPRHFKHFYFLNNLEFFNRWSIQKIYPELPHAFNSIIRNNYLNFLLPIFDFASLKNDNMFFIECAANTIDEKFLLYENVFYDSYYGFTINPYTYNFIDNVNFQDVFNFYWVNFFDIFEKYFFGKFPQNLSFNDLYLKNADKTDYSLEDFLNYEVLIWNNYFKDLGDLDLLVYKDHKGFDNFYSQQLSYYYSGLKNDMNYSVNSFIPRLAIDDVSFKKSRLEMNHFHIDKKRKTTQMYRDRDTYLHNKWLQFNQFNQSTNVKSITSRRSFWLMKYKEKFSFFYLFILFKKIYQYFYFLIFLIRTNFFLLIKFYLIISFIIIFLISLKQTFLSFFAILRALQIWYSRDKLLFFQKNNFIESEKIFNFIPFKNLSGLNGEYEKKYILQIWQYFLSSNSDYISHCLIGKDYLFFRKNFIYFFFLKFYKILINFMFIFFFDFLDFLKINLFNFLSYLKNLNLYKFLNFYYINIKLFFIKQYLKFLTFLKFFIFNKKYIKSFFSLNSFLYILKFLIYCSKILFKILFFFFTFFVFIYFLNRYLIINNMYVTQLPTTTLMLVFIFFVIWFLSIISNKFCDNILEYKFSENEYMQEFNGSFVDDFADDEEASYQLMDEELEELDEDSFPYIYTYYSITFLLKYKFSKNLKPDSFFTTFIDTLFGLKRNNIMIQSEREAFDEYIFKDLELRKLHLLSLGRSELHEYEESLKTVKSLVEKFNNCNNSNQNNINYFKHLSEIYSIENFNKVYYDWYYITRSNFVSNSPYEYPRETFLVEVAYTDWLVFEDDDEVNAVPWDENLDPSDDFEDVVEDELRSVDEEFDLYDPGDDLSFQNNFFLQSSILYGGTDYNYNKEYYEIFASREFGDSDIIFDFGWSDEIIIDRFVINTVDEDFLFPHDLEIVTFLNEYSFYESLNSVNIDDSLLDTNLDDFRNLLIFFMSSMNPNKPFRHNIYTAVLDSLILLNPSLKNDYASQPNSTISNLPNEQEYFIKMLFEANEIYMLNPLDVVFKLQKRPVLVNFNPYKNLNKAKNFFHLRNYPILGYESYNNKFKRLFFSNLEYYKKILNLQHYPDLTYEEIERLWNFLGCTKTQWSSFDYQQKNTIIFPFNNYVLPFFLSFYFIYIYLYKIHHLYYKLEEREGVFFFNFLENIPILNFFLNTPELSEFRRNSIQSKHKFVPMEEHPFELVLKFFKNFFNFFSDFINSDTFVLFGENFFDIFDLQRLQFFFSFDFLLFFKFTFLFLEPSYIYFFFFIYIFKLILYISLIFNFFISYLINFFNINFFFLLFFGNHFPLVFFFSKFIYLIFFFFDFFFSFFFYIFFSFFEFSLFLKGFFNIFFFFLNAYIFIYIIIILFIIYFFKLLYLND
jgi:hypothetical protein